MSQQITGEIVAGSGANFTLAHSCTANTLALYGSGVRLTGSGVDYTQSGATLAIITFTNPETYAAGTVTADYETSDNLYNTTQVGVDVLSPLALTTLQRCKDLLFDPNQTILVTGCSLTNGSETVTGCTIPTGKTVVAGQAISGLGILTGTVVASISGTTITLSQCLSENKLSLLNRLATPLLNSLNPLPFSPLFLNFGGMLGCGPVRTDAAMTAGICATRAI